MKTLDSFVSNNWRAILGLFIYMAVFYAGYKGLENEVGRNTRRLQTYINEIKVIERENVNLKITVAKLEEQIKKCK